jgi:penicillin amidase
MKKVFFAAVGLLVLLVPSFFSSSAQNQPGTTVQVPGLRGPVTIRRDDRGIPYIEATNDEDLYFAQGYVTASDRLWQMDLQRRTVRGQLSEIFGNAAVAQDKLHRRFGFAKMIDEAAAHLDPSFNPAVVAYTKGVNAFISSRNDQTMPPEFRVLQYKPAEWTAGDSLAVGALMAEYLSNTWQLDVMRESLASLPKEKRDTLLPDTSPLDVVVVGGDHARRAAGSAGILPAVSRAQSADTQILAQLTELIDAEQQSFELLGLSPRSLETLQASNNWVVSGKRTASGKPLLANDPHIPASAPNVWYQTELIAPGIHVAGVTFPGLPGIIIGHNERIAWGVTNLGPDVQDLYVEKFDKDNPTKYQTPTGWRDAEVRHEQINVRKNPIDPKSIEAQMFDVVVTRHGPIILEKENTRYALRWTMLDPVTLETPGIFAINRARNWKEFTAALSTYNGPTQNFVYADVDGHIGYYGAGRIPIRKSGDGSVPYDGAMDDGEWTGLIPFDKLPHVYDPPTGIIVTANQRVVGSDYPFFVSHVWASPYRARRIFDLLSAKPKLTIDDFRSIQGDVYSIGNVAFARAAAKLLSEPPASAGGSSPGGVSEPGAVATGSMTQLMKDLDSWDGKMTADSRTALIVSQMRTAFRQRVINAALGSLASSYFWPETDVLIDRIIAEQPREWLPKEFASYADLVKASYEDARQALTKSLGADETKWIWGAQAKARFNHPLAQVPFIGTPYFIEPFPQNGTGGAAATVNVGSSVSMRFIADVSDWDKSQNGIPLGQSGLPNNPHWKDQLDDWRKVTPRPFPFSKAAVEAATRETLTLTPKS